MIDRTQVAALLPTRRWFGAKERVISGVEVWDEATVVEGDPALVLALVAVRYANHPPDCYHMPLLLGEDGTIRDAFDDVEQLRILGRLMSQGETIKGAAGLFHFGGAGLDPRSPPGGDSVRVLGAEQSNSSLVLDESVIVKLFRRVEPGPNPELELTRLLTTEGFENVPPHVGDVLYEGEMDDRNIEIDLGVAQLLIDGREGWATVLEELVDALDPRARTADLDTMVAERASRSLDELARLGDVTAAFHVVLARDELEPDVSSEPVTGEDLKEWARRITTARQRLVDSGAAEMEPHATAVSSVAEALGTVADPGRKTRIHGDYHLGQVLLAARGWMILDLEGEPARSLEDRRAKQSPLRDVAGMLRSFDYAATAALIERAERGSPEWRALEPQAAAWERAARQRFLASYLATSHEGGFLPADRNDLFVMLDAFEIDKALYEVGYERAHRPDWLPIPVSGLARILEESGRSRR